MTMSLANDVDRVLTGRPDWWHEAAQGSWTAWCFGQLGVAGLVVTVTSDIELVLYIARDDREVRLPTALDLIEWLEANEHKHRGLTPLQVELGQHLVVAEAEDFLREARDT
jgi:hypothetical protein